jgi:hypothetical protein
MNVIDTVSREKAGTEMNTFTINNDNYIAAFATQEEATAADTTPFDSFASERELTELTCNWPADRLVATWNNLPGVTPVERFKDRKTGISRIWKRIQGLAEPPQPEPGQKATVARRVPLVASSKAQSTKKASPPKKAPKGQKKAAAGARQGSKTAEVIALLERSKGATLAQIMETTGWQAHSVRGFLSGTLGKKMGRPVESAKREDGERIYALKA